MHKRTSVGGMRITFSGSQNVFSGKQLYLWSKNIVASMFCTLISWVTILKQDCVHRLEKSSKDALLEILKIHLGAFLYNLLQGSCVSGRIGLDDLQRFYPASMILWLLFFFSYPFSDFPPSFFSWVLYGLDQAEGVWWRPGIGPFWVGSLSLAIFINISQQISLLSHALVASGALICLLSK